MAELDTRRELARQILARRFGDRTHQDIPVRTADTTVPLTPTQAGIWFAAQLFPNSPEYNVFDLVTIARRLDAGQVASAGRRLTERHDALRLAIELVDDQPRQYARPPYTPEVDWHDLSGLAEPAARHVAEQVVGHATQVLLGSDRSPLMRLTAIALPEDRTQVLLVLHHVIADFVTEAMLLDELSRMLVGLSLPPAPTTAFLDYAAWSAGRAEPARVEADLDWWRAQLAGDLPRLEVPFDRPRPAQPTRGGHSIPFTVPAETVTRLRRLAAERGTTLFVLFLAAYDVLLARLSGATDVIVGTALLGRDHPETERMAGCFVHTVPLRATVDRAMSFLDVVDAAHRALTEAQDHRAVRFERIVEALGTPRELGVHPVFQTYFGFLTSEPQLVPGVTNDSTGIVNYGAAKWDMSVSLWDTADQVTGIMESSADLFELSTIELHRDLYLRLTEALAGAPEVPIGRHPLVVGQQRARVLEGSGRFVEADIRYPTLSAPFELQAARTPDAVAVESGSGPMTYAEFERWTGRLARLLRDRKVGRVALLMDRSVQMLAAIYATARSGAVYIPLDPEIPVARQQLMLADTVPDLVIADRGRGDQVGAGPWTVLEFEQLDELGNRHEATVADPAVGGDGRNLSHLLYTSGSTGRPKAVMCTVATAVADIQAMQRSLDYRPEDAVLFKTSYGFDTSLWEIFWPLYVGARIVVCPPGEEKDPVRLADTIERHRVSVVDLTPTVLQAFLDELRPGRCTSLRYLHTGGEPVSVAIRDGFRMRSTACLINGYGPTETGCIAHAHIESDRSATMPVGHPHQHVRVRILDENGEPVPPGVPGEAHICSSTMAWGYHGRPALTAERFVPDPFGGPGSRMYRTGDVCRERADGTLEVLGRLDQQVKVRGLRVELGEIENAAAQLPGIADCVVVTIGSGPDLRLAAFVTARPGCEPEPRAVRDGLARVLPRHMVPAGVQVLQRIPVTVNGKVDRAALQRMWTPQSLVSSASEPPADQVEAELAAIFADVLGLPRIGVTDGFFDNGGHSLLLFRLIAACERRLGIRPQVADVFAAPTVRLLAERLRSGPRARSALLPLDPRPGLPLVAFVHAVSGSALPFREVAAQLGAEYSCYGVQTQQYADGDPVPSLVELAAEHVAAVDEIRGLSPVYLVGWSMGGCVAVEMARCWRQRGVRVAGLVLLDSWLPPAAMTDPDDRAAARMALSSIALDDLEHAATVLSDDPTELARLRRTADANSAAYLDYVPTPLDIQAHLLRAAVLPGGVADALPAPYRDAMLDWGRLLGSVEVDTVPGDHYSLVHAEHAPALAAALQKILEADDEFGEL